MGFKFGDRCIWGSTEVIYGGGESGGFVWAMDDNGSAQWVEIKTLAHVIDDEKTDCDPQIESNTRLSVDEFLKIVGELNGFRR